MIDLKMLAEHLSVEEDLLTDYVFGNGFDVTQSQTVAAIDHVVRVVEPREASTVVAVADAAMPLLRHWLGSTPLWKFCPLRAATCLVEAALPAAAANAFVFLLAFVMKRGCIAERASVLWQGICSVRHGASLPVKLRTAAAAMTFCQTSLSCTVLLP